MANEVALNLGRDGDDAGQPGKDPLVGRIVDATFAGVMTGPAMRRRHCHDRFDCRQQKGEQVGLVVMRVDDVNRVLANQAAQCEPDRRVERAAFFRSTYGMLAAAARWSKSNCSSPRWRM